MPFSFSHFSPSYFSLSIYVSMSWVYTINKLESIKAVWGRKVVEIREWLSLAISYQAFRLGTFGLGVSFKIFTARLGSSSRIAQMQFQKIKITFNLFLSVSQFTLYLLFPRVDTYSLSLSLFLSLPFYNLLYNKLLTSIFVSFRNKITFI